MKRLALLCKSGTQYSFDKACQLITELDRYYESLSDESKNNFVEQFKIHKRFGKNLSFNGLNIAKKIKSQLGIEVFPYCHAVAHKGYPISDGTYSFTMTILSNSYYNRDVNVATFIRSKEFLKKNVKLKLGEVFGASSTSILIDVYNDEK